MRKLLDEGVAKIRPVPAPRQVLSDKWAPRPAVKRYRAFRDELNLCCRVVLPKRTVEAQLTFGMPMPPSWAKKKRKRLRGGHHRQRPDLDNLVKAFLDALSYEDSHIAVVHARKLWTEDETGWIKYKFLEEVEEE